MYLKYSDNQSWIVSYQKTIDQVKEKNPDYTPTLEKSLQEKINKQKEAHNKFPFVICVEGDSPVISYARRWCWSKWGEDEGLCYDYHEDYPACPLVLETEEISEYIYFDSDKEEKVGYEKLYYQAKNHTHNGTWKALPLEKNGYEKFVYDFCFSNSNQLEEFIKELPNFNWGESFQ